MINNIDKTIEKVFTSLFIMPIYWYIIMEMVWAFHQVGLFPITAIWLLYVIRYSPIVVAVIVYGYKIYQFINNNRDGSYYY